MLKHKDGTEQRINVANITDDHCHYGGAWKVAYADFATAMMAFFLLLWLLSTTTQEQRDAIANYFDPTHPKVSISESGSGGIMGGLTMSPQGAQSSNKQPITPPPPSKVRPTAQQPAKSAKEQRIEKVKAERRKKEEKRLKDAESKIKQAIKENPKLAALEKNLMIDMTPEGLRIQIVDDEGKPMFASGSARMFEKTRALIDKISEIIQETPNDISVRGHTDSVPFGSGAEYTNWELSSDRANSSRRALIDSGVPKERLSDVIGKADTEPLLPEDPANARNRRITIILLKEELTNTNYEKEVEEESLGEEYDDEEFENENVDQFNSIPDQPPVGTFRRTPGAVQFP